MLMVAKAGREEVITVCRKWDLDVAVIGRVTDTGKVVLKREWASGGGDSS